ncbi:ankyrin repeat domain-containing protein [Dactylosporangium sucinum]|uniref:Ankyrin repeat domain-containing protein n=1 Tax=Dactylosporangium sucinum TaxID=1424081 RepID=A0A917X758_9ACTN|nr:hypothetical protein [Dactylosporangium sucinum]GGM84444.1 hypothetical protein GCM10007977_102490 [Dactylosporangium sucinum]
MGPYLRQWLSYRRFAVPAETIDLATARRLDGDWRGACAAARIQVGDLPPVVEEDLRHLVPDLLRWHLPQPGHATWDWYDEVVPVARYPDGSALLLNRRSMLSFARSVPRAMVELPRHLWDDRHTAGLRDVCGPAPVRPGAACAHVTGRGRACAEAAGIDPGSAPPDVFEQPWVWSRLLPAARALLARLRRREPVVRLGPALFLDLDGPRLLTDGPAAAARLRAAAAARLRAGEWMEPLDAELVRHRYLDPAELHPLVHEALVGPYRRPHRPSPVDAVVPVPCGPATHRLAIRAGALVALDHTVEDLGREAVLGALGGPAAGCSVALDRWRTGGEPLPDELERLHDELWQRVLYGDSAGVVRLLEAGFPPVPGRGGTTLVHALDQLDFATVLPVLLRLGLDVNARSAAGRTPLHHVLRRGLCSDALVEALLRAGADPRLRDTGGRDAYRCAGNRPHLHAVFDRFV